MSELLFARQSVAVDKLVEARRGIAWWKVGEGKSRIGLFAFAALQRIYKWSLPSICLIVCRPKAFYDWRKEINTCFPGASVYENDIPTHPPSKLPVFLLVSHGSMWHFRKYNEKVKENESFTRIRDNHFIRFVILDELWLYASNTSARFIAARAITKTRMAVGLSGTVMKARDISEIYCQAWVVGVHKYLAGSLTKFRTLYEKNKWRDLGFRAKAVKSGSYKKIMSALSDVVDVHFPKGKRLITEQYHDIPATPQQKRYFKELRESYSIDDFNLEYDHAIVISIKAQQIANGWIKNDEGRHISIPTNKVEKLEDELSDIVASGERCIVWCAFRHDVAMLAASIKITSVQMVAGKPFDLERWKHPSTRICFATEASGSSFNHFEHVPYAIYFSCDEKWLNMQQSRGRTDRKSSKHQQCFYKHLQVEGSMDAKIFKVAMESGNAERRLIQSTKQWLTLK